ncbi:TetR/AcrR family transcriptional regulator [Mycolicibacterium septicum]|uniref:TetR/AcrR family transcriptional regulator n=1 Tax=Mycolicibacterium septicum TaxID=98668 RepID=UPI00235FE646|nr:TetR family transcriptional regulator [Mycolicibacterium septicum]
MSRQASQRPERKGERTRRRILEAARNVFAEVGYDRATIRGIAAAADVDKSSVIKYFGTKQNLFQEAATWAIEIPDATAPEGSSTAENLSRGMFRAWSAEPNSPMAVLLRTSMTSEDAAGILREHLATHTTPVIAEVIDQPDARLRAALVGAMLSGIASQRYLLHVPDICDADIDEILRIITPAVDAIISPS